MGKCKKLSLVLGFVVFLSCVFLLQSAFAAEKIVYVDLALVFDGYQKTKDFDSKLETDQKAKQKDIDKRVEDIKKLQEKLPLLSEKEKKEKQEQIDKDTRALQEFQRDAETDLKDLRNESLKEVLKDIQDVVSAISKEKGYDFILDGRTILYGDTKLDITKDVLQKVNDNYKNSKTK